MLVHFFLKDPLFPLPLVGISQGLSLSPTRFHLDCLPVAHLEFACKIQMPQKIPMLFQYFRAPLNVISIQIRCFIYIFLVIYLYLKATCYLPHPLLPLEIMIQFKRKRDWQAKYPLEKKKCQLETFKLLNFDFGLIFFNWVSKIQIYVCVMGRVYLHQVTVPVTFIFINNCVELSYKSPAECERRFPGAERHPAPFQKLP